MTPSPEQPEHEEARRLADKLLTENERKLAKASWAYGVVADPNIPKWGNLVLEAYDAAAALLSKAEQERDARRDRKVLCEQQERELERLREALQLWHEAYRPYREDMVRLALDATDAALLADTQR